MKTLWLLPLDFFNQLVKNLFKTTAGRSSRFLCFSARSLPRVPPSFTAIPSGASFAHLLVSSIVPIAFNSVHYWSRRGPSFWLEDPFKGLKFTAGQFYLLFLFFNLGGCANGIARKYTEGYGCSKPQSTYISMRVYVSRIKPNSTKLPVCLEQLWMSETYCHLCACDGCPTFQNIYGTHLKIERRHLAEHKS